MKHPELVALACLLSAACLPPVETPVEAPVETLIERARRIHADAIVIDTHSDTTPYFEDPEFRFDERHSKSELHMDLPRIREGGLDVEFWSIYMGKREGDGRAIREALERIDAVHEMVATHPNIELATSVADVRKHVAEGHFVSMMGLEGGHIIEDSFAALRNFYRLGVRYMTLTHSFHTSWADSSGTRTAPEPVHDGLTDRGVAVVREMNRLGMMVDISHVSDATFWDAIEATHAPLIASHSSIRSVYDHGRNMSDDMLRALARNGGVVMINFYSGYIDPEIGEEMRRYYETWEPTLRELGKRHADDWWALWNARREHYERWPTPQAQLSVLLDHYDRAIAVAGPDHVGIGADWDGISSLPIGMDEVNLLPDLTLGLLQRGHSEETVRKVLGENLLRVLSEVEEVGAKLRETDPAGPIRLEAPPTSH